MENVIKRYEDFVTWFINNHVIDWLVGIEIVIATFAVGVVTIISKVVTIMVGRPEMLELTLAWVMIYLMTEHVVVMISTETYEE